jgi:dTMP kinase
MFIDFEGIDGSGKTTLSQVVAERLKDLGIEVYHTRDKGEYKSRISKSLRKVVRDPQNLGLLPWAEFLAYMARDAQVFNEKILPHLDEGGVVISDRFFYSHVLLGEARGLARGRLDEVMSAVSGGVEPDLVVYCDVDIHTSRIRKKIADIIEHDSGSFARKGLSGIGLRRQMREGFLALASSDPGRWVVIDNARVAESEIAKYVWYVVSTRLADRGVLPPAAIGRRNTPPAKHQSAVKPPDSSLPDGGHEIAGLFFAALEALMGFDSRLSAYYVAGLDLPAADALREKLKGVQPAMVAYGLRDVCSEASWRLRGELAATEPGYIALSLTGLPLEGEALELRRNLKKKAPREAAESLKGLECDISMQLREELFEESPEGVLESVKGMDTNRAWAFRDKCGKKFHPEALAESLRGIDSPRAWEIRNRLPEKYSAWVLRGLGPLESEQAWEMRERFIDLAPKLVAKTLDGLDSDRAHDMRERIGSQAKEVLDSLKGLESPRAWKLRESLKDIYASTAVSSLNAPNNSAGAWRFRDEMLRSHPDDLLLVKHIVQALRGTDRL